MHRSEAVIDLAAIASNVSLLKSNTAADLMAVVKADGYGHGLVPAARAAVAGGASWLGVAMLEEAIALRAAGFTERVLAWLWTPRETDALRGALAAGVDISVSSMAGLELVVATAAELGSPARVHLKIDTGLSRNGATAADWPALVAAAAKAGSSGVIERPASGATSSTPTHPATRPRRGRSSGSARRSRWPRGLAWCPRYGTWPTRRPP